MLNPKRSQISVAAGTFSTEEQGLWLPILVGSRVYNAYSPPVFGDVASKLAGVVADTLQAKQLNATMTLIDRIGPTDASTSGAEGTYATMENREGLIEYAFSVLYGANYWTRIHSVPHSYRARNRAVLR